MDSLINDWWRTWQHATKGVTVLGELEKAMGCPQGSPISPTIASWLASWHDDPEALQHIDPHAAASWIAIYHMRIIIFE